MSLLLPHEFNMVMSIKPSTSPALFIGATGDGDIGKMFTQTISDANYQNMQVILFTKRTLAHKRDDYVSSGKLTAGAISTNTVVVALPSTDADVTLNKCAFNGTLIDQIMIVRTGYYEGTVTPIIVDTYESCTIGSVITYKIEPQSVTVFDFFYQKLTIEHGVGDLATNKLTGSKGVTLDLNLKTVK